MASSGDGRRSAESKRERDTVPTESTRPQTPGRLRRHRIRRVPQLPELLESTKHYLAACPRRGLAQKKPQLLLQQFSVFSFPSLPCWVRGNMGRCALYSGPEMKV